MGEWYTIDQVCMFIFNSKVGNAAIIDFEKAREKEYYFTDIELNKFKAEYLNITREQSPPIAAKARLLSKLLPIKNGRKESRVKKLPSIKFIRDEI